MTLPHLEALTAAATETHIMYDIGFPDGPVEDGLGSKNPAEKMKLALLAPDLAAAVIEAEPIIDKAVDEIESWVFIYATGGCSEGQMIDAIVAEKEALKDALVRLRSLDQQIGGQT